MATHRTKRIAWIGVVIGALLVSAVSVFALSFGKYEKVKATAGVVSIPLTKVSDGKAHYYRFEDGGKQIDFIVAKTADGTVRTAFDACDTCFHARKGYEQKGNMLVCKNCNRQFAINRIGPHEIGGCNPSYLPSRVIGNQITFTVSALKAGARFF